MKTRRVRKQRNRKTRQKGGKQIFLKLKKLLNGTEENREYTIKTESFNVTGKTPKNLFENYKIRNNAMMHATGPLYKNGNPRFLLKKTSGQSRPIGIDPTNWKKSDLLINEGTYEFMYIAETPEEKARKEAEWVQTLRTVLNHYRDTGAKIITFSSAATGDIPKNVNQQFKFHANPKTPILLIDPAFFKKDRHEFFQYLKFEGPFPIEHTNEKARIYRKPAGRPFEILGDQANAFPIELQKKYLAEVNQQRFRGGIYHFNEMDELEICCVQAGVPSGNEFAELLEPFDNRFQVYLFGS